MADIGQRPRGAELLVCGYFKADLVVPYGQERNKTITAVLETEGLEDMVEHFRPRYFHWKRDGRVWSILRCVQEVGYRMDYILGTYRCLLQNISVLDPRHNSDHYLVLGCLRSENLREH